MGIHITGDLIMMRLEGQRKVNEVDYQTSAYLQQPIYQAASLLQTEGHSQS